MPLTTAQRAEIVSEALSFWRTRFADQAIALGSSIGRNASEQALAMYQLIKAVEDADREWPPNQNSSAAALALAAETFGLPSNKGGYGPNGPTLASGGVAPLTGAKGTAFTSGLVATAPDGVTQVKLSGTVSITGAPPGTGTVNGSFVAVTPGAAGNLESPATLTWVTPPAGADGQVVLSAGLSGALDSESPAELLERLLVRLQLPPKGGAEPDYLVWPRVAGVLRVYEYARRGGTGTVHLVIVAGGAGLGRIPSAMVLANSQAAVDAARPVAVETALVMVPDMPAVNGHRVFIRIVAVVPFDWDSTGASYLVTAVAPGGGLGGGDRVTLGTAPPVSLTNAVDLGLRPRVYFSATSGPAVALQAEVVAYNVGAKTVDLASPNPTGWVTPVATDPMFAGGAAYTPIASALAAYVDGLGPSKASGYADTLQPWDDTIRIAQLEKIALNALDTDGVTRVASDLVAGAGATIDGGSVNVTGGDVGVNVPPELLRLIAIVVSA